MAILTITEADMVQSTVGPYGSPDTWANLLAAAGNLSDPEYFLWYFEAFMDADTWMGILRRIILVDTSGIPDGATINSVTLRIYGNGYEGGYKLNPAGWANLKANVFNVSVASPPSIAATDFANVGDTPYSDSPIDYDDYVEDDWNEFSFNAAGIAAINDSGYTQLALREVTYDLGATSPSWSAGMPAWFHGADTELVIDYTEAPATKGGLNPAIACLT